MTDEAPLGITAIYIHWKLPWHPLISLRLQWPPHALLQPRPQPVYMDHTAIATLLFELTWDVFEEPTAGSDAAQGQNPHRVKNSQPLPLYVQHL